MYSGTSTVVVERNGYAVPTYSGNNAWTADIPGATWIWDTYSANEINDGEDEIFTFKESFTVNNPTFANLDIAADNDYEISVNGVVKVPFTGGSHFGFLSKDDINMLPFLGSGENVLTIRVKNFGVNNRNSIQNPAGLLYKLVVKGDKNESCKLTTAPELVKTSGPVTMCKEDTNENRLSGWTMTLLQGKVEDVTVQANNSAGANTAAVLTALKPYVAVATGVWNNQGSANPVDAEYSTTDNWATQMDGYTGYQNDILELQINNTFDPNSNWGAYNSAHKYAQSFVPAVAGVANFRIFDGTGTTINEAWYPDNSGSLSVSVYEGFAGITNTDGCVTFSDVPFGTYTAGEIMQDGWKLASGGGSVVVSSSTSPVTIINEKIEAEPATYFIDGFKWNDANGNGLRDSGEVGIAGWGITLFQNGAAVGISTTTDADGYYRFTVASSTYVVREEVRVGWTPTGLTRLGASIVTKAGECVFNDFPEITASDSVGGTCSFGNQLNIPPIIVPPVDTPVAQNSGGGGSSSSGTRTDRFSTLAAAPEGQVLGAATTNLCPFLKDFMQIGVPNDSFEVTKLQLFLNIFKDLYGGEENPVNGVFGEVTDLNVKKFQAKYHTEILDPWYEQGIVPHKNPTGFVYKTTLWKINSIVCPEYAVLPNFAGEDLTINTDLRKGGVDI